MGNAMHQYALFGTAQFKYDQTITHISDQHRQIVICNNGSDVRYATLEEWEEAGALFDERAQIEGIVTSAGSAHRCGVRAGGERGLAPATRGRWEGHRLQSVVDSDSG